MLTVLLILTLQLMVVEVLLEVLLLVEVEVELVRLGRMVKLETLE